MENAFIDDIAEERSYGYLFPSPYWESKVEVEVVESMQEAIAMEWTDRSKVKIYGDGSGIDRGIGAAAVVYKSDKRMKTLQVRVGEAKEHEVYDGEGIALSLYLEPLQTMKNIETAIINLDHCLLDLNSNQE